MTEQKDVLAQDATAWRWNTLGDQSWRVSIDRPVPTNLTAFDKIEPLYLACPSPAATARQLRPFQPGEKGAPVAWDCADEEYREHAYHQMAVEIAHLRDQVEDARGYVERAIASYEGNPADNNFQKGFLAALEVVRDEAFGPSITSTVGEGK